MFSYASAIVCLLYTFFAVYMFILPQELVSYLRDEGFGSLEYCSGFWRMAGVEMMGVALICSKQVVKPNRGVLLGLAGMSLVVMIGCSTELLGLTSGWNHPLVLGIAGIHMIVFALSLHLIAKLPVAVKNAESPKFVLM